jgi:hypothetical protein
MTRLSWPTVGLIGVLAAVAVALAALTDWGSGEILGLIGVLGGIGGGAAVAGGVAGRVDDVFNETVGQSETLGTIAHRVNGELDARIAAGADQAANAVLAELRAQGVIR